MFSFYTYSIAFKGYSISPRFPLKKHVFALINFDIQGILMFQDRYPCMYIGHILILIGLESRFKNAKWFVKWSLT